MKWNFLISSISNVVDYFGIISHKRYDAGLSFWNEMKWDEMPFPWGMVRENEGACPLHYWLNWVFPFRPYLFSRVSFFPLFNEDGRESLHFSWRDSFVQWEPYLSSLHTFAKIATAIHIYIYFSPFFFFYRLVAVSFTITCFVRLLGLSAPVRVRKWAEFDRPSRWQR